MVGRAGRSERPAAPGAGAVWSESDGELQARDCDNIGGEFSDLWTVEGQGV